VFVIISSTIKTVLMFLIRGVSAGFIPQKHKSTLSETSLKICHTLSRQCYGTEILCLQRDLWYGDFSFQLVLKITSNKFLMILVK
jgi:hypothetical protein